MISNICVRLPTFAAIAAASLLSVAPALAAAAGGPEPGEGLSQSYRESQMDNIEYQKVDPIKMADNLYYIGPGYVGVYLITTPEGHILIDTAQDPYIDFVLDNIHEVGADPMDIKYILISHGHLDHFGGAAAIQELTGAQVGVVAEDWEMMQAASQRPGRDGSPPPRIPHQDFVIRDGDTITLGGQTVTLYNTPGHTPGVMSAEFTVYDHGTPHKAFFSGGTGSRGPELDQPAVNSTAKVLQIQNIEMFLPNHAWNAGNPYPDGSIFERAQRIAEGQPNPFIDGPAWTQWIAIAHQRNVERAAGGGAGGGE
jgi:metallo-beta-lactamase class B